MSYRNNRIKLYDNITNISPKNIFDFASNAFIFHANKRWYFEKFKLRFDVAQIDGIMNKLSKTCISSINLSSTSIFEWPKILFFHKYAEIQLIFPQYQFFWSFCFVIISFFLQWILCKWICDRICNALHCIFLLLENFQCFMAIYREK